MERWHCLLVAAVFSSLSILGCLVVVFRTGRLGARFKRRLFVRQLRTLAWVDICYSVLFLAYALINLGYLRPSDEEGDIVCWTLDPCFVFFRCASALTETHIALGIAGTWRRGVRLLRALERVVTCILPLSLAVTFADRLVTRRKFSLNKFGAWCDRQGPQYVQFGCIALCFAVSLVAYLSALVPVGLSTGSAQRTLWRQSLVYPLNFFLTYGPVLRYDERQLPEVSIGSWLALVGYGLESCNGFLNAMAYFYQSRYARLRGCRQSRLRERQVSNELAPRLGDTVSLHILFITDVSVIDVGFDSEGAPAVPSELFSREGCGCDAP